jgi:LPPG:FO 2-phospho-L-lactate transferase
VALRVAALAGGVGGAKLAAGLASALQPEALTVIVNTGDDFDHLGLAICPDLDTVVYTLAGVANPDTGWGRSGETWNFLTCLGDLGGPTWFRLGDKDLAVHVERTRRLRDGTPLSAVVDDMRRRLGVRARVLPMSDQPIHTRVLTAEGEIPFQEYFVARGCEPIVKGFRFEGVEAAVPAPGVLEAIDQSSFVALCPSNPWVSLDPILSVPGMREAVNERTVVGVSPIVGGQAVKGPAAKMFSELGVPPSSFAFADHYRGLLTGLVIDRQDATEEPVIARLGIEVLVTDTLMVSPSDRQRLAEEVLRFAGRLTTGGSRR